VSARTAQVVYHVGAHKTGTSLVQSYLSQNRRMLRKQGLTYLTRETLESWVKSADGEADDAGVMHRRISGAFLRRPDGVVVASYENTIGPPFAGKHADGLYPRAAQRAEALRDALAKYSTKVLLGIRPQSGFVESYYIQKVQQGDYRTFDDWFGELDLDRLSWRPVVDTLVATFGRDNVEVIDFNLIRNGTLAYVRGFLDRIDPDVHVDEAAPRDNASLSDKGLRIALAVNPHLTEKGERVAMRKFLQDQYPNTRYPRPVLLSEAQRTDLDERYTAEYDELVRDFG
jgi:hypothetical protein